MSTKKIEIANPCEANAELAVAYARRGMSKEVLALTDENTIGVVAILGTTFTGEFEPIEAIHAALVE